MFYRGHSGFHRESDLLTVCSWVSDRAGMGTQVFLAVKCTPLDCHPASSRQGQGTLRDVELHPKVTSELITNQPKKSGFLYS